MLLMGPFQRLRMPKRSYKSTTPFVRWDTHKLGRKVGIDYFTNPPYWKFLGHFVITATSAGDGEQKLHFALFTTHLFSANGNRYASHTTLTKYTYLYLSLFFKLGPKCCCYWCGTVTREDYHSQRCSLKTIAECFISECNFNFGRKTFMRQVENGSHKTLS